MQDEFYKIKPAVDTKETGNVFPAVVSFDNYDFKSPSSVHNLKSHIPISNKIDIRFKLAENANCTDLLSQATINSTGLLVSKDFLEVLDKFNIIPFSKIPVKITSRNSVIIYFWIHFIWRDWHKYVDWTASTFKLFENGKFIPIVINSYSQYLEEVNKSQFFRIGRDKHVLTSISYDLYNHPFEGEFYISADLAAAIISSKLTGINISSTPKLIT